MLSIKKMFRQKKQWVWFFGFLICFIALIIGLYIRMTFVRVATLDTASENKLTPVRAQKAIRTQEVWKASSFLARVEDAQTIDVIADVGGWVVEKKVALGQSVQKGESLIVLEDSRKLLKLKEAQARLKSARANLNEIERKHKQSLTLVEKGIVARDILDSLSNQIASESAKIDSLKASYNLMRWDVDSLNIASPISGRIVKVLPDVGQEVRAGELVIKMASAKEKRVAAGVEPRQARIIKPGMKVRLRTRANEENQGEIIGVSPNMDSFSGTYSVEARIINDNHSWLAGEVVSMEIPVDLLTDVVIVPRTTVLSDSEDSFIFVYQDGKAIKIPISVEWINEEEGCIPARLIPEGAMIITEGHVGLAGGQPVRLMR